jgi:hypothetical protein
MAAPPAPPYRPLGLIKNMLDELGLELTHYYEDLIFVQHSALLLRMEERGEDVSLFFNTESDPAKREEIIVALTAAGGEQNIAITRRGTFSLTPNEADQSLDITFYEET